MVIGHYNNQGDDRIPFVRYIPQVMRKIVSDLNESLIIVMDKDLIDYVPLMVYHEAMPDPTVPVICDGEDNLSALLERVGSGIIMAVTTSVNKPREVDGRSIVSFIPEPYLLTYSVNEYRLIKSIIVG